MAAMVRTTGNVTGGGWGGVEVAMPRRTDRLSVTELIRLGLEVLYMNVGEEIRFVLAKNVKRTQL